MAARRDIVHAAAPAHARFVEVAASYASAVRKNTDARGLRADCDMSSVLVFFTCVYNGRPDIHEAQGWCCNASMHPSGN